MTDEATIRDALTSPAGRRVFGETALAALDRLVADRDTAQAKVAANAVTAEHNYQRAESAEAEVAVLTARLEAADSDLGEAVKGFVFERERVEVLTARLTEADEALAGLLDSDCIIVSIPEDPVVVRARAALAGERGDRHNEDGGTASSPRGESGQA